MYDFHVKQKTEECIQWLRNWFEENGKDCNAVLGISGGKDSSVAAALCVKALGKERVIGVLMPCGHQEDIEMSRKLVEHLEIPSYEINIKKAVDGILEELEGIEVVKQTRTNLPARIRMAAVYAVSQSKNGRVINTCNLSEDWVGYSTRYGDAAGDVSPLSHFTVQEVKAIGRELGLPEELVDKVPIDGLSGKTDEENLGFSYEDLDRYIREGICEEGLKKRIDELHKRNLFKLELMPAFLSDLPVKADK